MHWTEGMEKAWTDYWSVTEKIETHPLMQKKIITSISKFESQVSADLHVLANWEETGAAKGNI